MDDRKTSLSGGAKPLAGGGGIFKSAAVAVLRQERKLMTTGDITRCEAVDSMCDTFLICCCAL